MSGPKSDSQKWGNSIHQHKVVRGKFLRQLLMLRRLRFGCR